MLDVTAERLAEARAAAAGRLVSLGDMAAGLAHELRQPLTTLSLAAELAQMDARKGHYAAMDGRLELVVAQAQRASDIIELLRRFARGPEAGAAQLALDLTEVIATLQALVGGALLDADVALDLCLGTPVPVPMGDRMALEQILVNLVMNARDAVVAGQGVRRVRIAAVQEGGEVLITVSDTGGGLPPAVLARAFEPFVTTKGPNRGTGLGLSICYGLARAMGGRIGVVNGAQGAIFTISLPAAGSAGGGPAAPAPEAPGAMSAG
jgi:C4-dicarboxylate-specific signal transduction histidine kinase